MGKGAKLAPEGLWAPEEDTHLEITPHDKTHNMAVAASAAWLMQGDDETAAAHVRERVGAMLVANPWLAARCTKEKSWVYPRTFAPSLLDRHFQRGEASLSYESYVALGQALREFTVENALALAGTSGSAFRVCVVRDRAHSGRFALVLSLNHVLGDGATMYALAAMLSGGEESVRALRAERHANFAAAQERVVGREEKGLFSFEHTGFTLGLIGSTLADVSRGRPRDLLAVEVDDAWLQQRKTEAAAAAGLPFVSSNDVLTSLVFAELLPAKVGLMEVSLRGRDERLLPAVATDAGNYTVMVPFFRGDAATPADVRRSLRVDDDGHFVARRHRATPIPGFTGMLSGPGRYVAVSNWASLDTVPLALPSCELIVHLPMMDMTVPSPFDGVVIWRPMPGRIGLMGFSRKKGLLPSAHPAFGRRLLGFQAVQRGAQKHKKGAPPAAAS